MKIIKNCGKLGIKFMDKEFTSNGEFAETLKDIAKRKNIDFDILVNTFCSQLLSNIEDNNIINY
jgi:hypothetical protein